MTGLQEVLWSEAARTLLLFQMSDLPCAFVLNQKSMFVPFHLNFCSVLNFWTYMFILCTLCFCHFALPALRRPSRSSRARPRHCCLQLYLGAEPEGLDPYCYCMFYYYYYYYYYYYSSSLPMGVYGSPMKGTWENDEIWHTLRYGHK